MFTGLFLVFAGFFILLYPQILVLMIAGFLIMLGGGIMVASWQFRRLKRRSNSQFVNWIARY